MNTPAHSRPQTAAALALVAPLAILAGIRLLASAGPASAPAALVAQPIAAPVVSLAPTLKQSQAAAWLAAWTPPELIESPMRHAARIAEAPSPAPAAQDAAPQPTAPQFTVKSVMGAGDRVMASINGKVYRIGDEPVPGWKITAMDAKSKRVSLAGPEGQSLSITPQMPQR